MKVIVNGRFFNSKITGVGRYARELISELDNLVEPGAVELAVPPEVKNIPVYNNIKVVRIGQLRNRLWEHISFPIYVKKQKSVSLNLCSVAPLLSPGIVCIHDMRIKTTDQSFSRAFVLWYRILFANAIKRAKTIITVSEFSKKEIQKYYKISADKIHVISPSWQHYNRIGYDERTLEKHDLKSQKYYFAIGSLEPNKNLRWIAETASHNPSEVFAVAGATNKTVFADGLNFDCPENMRMLGYVSDAEAKTLMRECKAFLFPTFYEGFGLPPLEAISAGAKCIMVSDTEVMHEVYGDYVNYINPYVYSDKLNCVPNEKSKKILKKYSWKLSAQKLSAVLGKYIEQHITN